MSSSYLDDKVREALAAAQGGRAMAQKTLMLWAWQDDRLLKEMAKPFLKAIAAAADPVERQLTAVTQPLHGVDVEVEHLRHLARREHATELGRSVRGHPSWPLSRWVIVAIAASRPDPRRPAT